MKKLILSAVIVLGTLSMQAGNVVVNSTAVQLVNVQDEYKEVDAVPAAIKTALDNAYPGVKLEKAWVNEKKEYKIEITVRGEKSTVYTDLAGNILKK
jgi:peptidoglycan hydrolase CwlO-like protein